MTTAYVLCATPRSGSTLLCELLSDSGVAGMPDSYFMADPGPEWRRIWGLPSPEGKKGPDHARAYLAAAIAAGRGQQGVFGLRLMYDTLDDMLNLIDQALPGLTSDRARLEAALGPVRFVHLFRKDKLAQAVSLVKAEQTGLWHIAPDGREVERLAAPSAPRYDRERINGALAKLSAADAGWVAWFAAEGIEPLKVSYESLAADPAGVTTRLIGELGLSPDKGVVLAPAVGRLADATSAAWMRRFRESSG